MPRIRIPSCECGHNSAHHADGAVCKGDFNGGCGCPQFVDANPTFADRIHEANRLRRDRPPVIDANTGEYLYPDRFITNVNGEFLVCWLDVGLLSGSAYIRRNLNVETLEERVEFTGFGETTMYRMVARRPAKLGPVERVPLVVRWTHPHFFGKRVGFFPS